MDNVGLGSGTVLSGGAPVPASPAVPEVPSLATTIVPSTHVMSTAQAPATIQPISGASTSIKQEPGPVKMMQSPLPPSPAVTPISQSTPPGASSRSIPSTPISGLGENKVLDKRRLHELVKEVDPLEQLDDDVEEVLMQIADDFIDNVSSAACQLARHRKSNTVEVKDVQLHLERNWNMLIPGFGAEELRPYKKAATTEAHKQRLALIKKTLKKY